MLVNVGLVTVLSGDTTNMAYLLQRVSMPPIIAPWILTESEKISRPGRKEESM